MDLDKKYIHRVLAGRHGVHESTEVNLSTDVSDGESTVVINHTISTRLPLNRENWAKAHGMYEDLTRMSGGRLCLELDHLIELLKRGQINLNK